MGTWGLDVQARSVGARIHCFGHSHLSLDRDVNGVRYVQNALGGFRDWSRRFEPKQIHPPLPFAPPSRDLEINPSKASLSEKMGFRARWYVAVDSMPAPGSSEFARLLGLLPVEDQEKLKKLKEVEARRRLASALLVRHCCARAFDIPFGDVIIKRTKGRKPFCGNDTSSYPCWTLNVSHDGDYVVLAAESCCVVGLDISAPEHLRPGWSGKSKGIIGLEQSGVNRELGRTEWERVRRSPEPYLAFQQHWACKEAISKAIGVGMQMNFSDVTFDIRSAGDGFEAIPYRKGVQQLQWKLDITYLCDHWIAVARGPCEEVIDAQGEFKAKLGRPSGIAWSAVVNAPPPAWEAIDLRMLLA
eukprot:TRINITY_DN39451_c0_g1_i1.p1 TRINITY_DN39451_c0_g1~~TRINITY_DN39451_c0_g1_i1.p1  ORF type:complete len:375 (+),score=31.84 TRINITY_DN39451_c0_g1_i1:53-1126(+)